MKKTFLLAIILSLCTTIFAQTNLVVTSTEKGLALTHTVAPKESLYSLGRLYNIPAKEIAAFNGIDMQKGLNVGQTIKVPLSTSNFSQTTEGGTPVYYVVGEKEGLYRVSVKNNKVLMENLRKWNNLNTDAISAGQKLVVGFLVSTEMQSVAANTNTQTQQPQNNPVVIKEEPKKVEPVKEEPKKEEKIQEPVKTETVQKPVPQNAVQATVNDGKGGYFKNQFDQQIRSFAANKEQTVTAGIFKTSSGWQDGKYYALMDGVEPGTIIRIVNPTNNKAVYAKILGEMSGIRQNQGLELRISNAAASVLDITETDKFIVRINY